MDKDLFIYNTIVNIGIIILFINVLLYFKSYRKNSIAFKIFTHYLLFIIIIQLVTFYMRFIKEPNLYFSHYYFIGRFILLNIFYTLLEKRNILKKSMQVILILVLVSIGMYYIKYPEIYFKFNPFEIAITSIPLAIYSFYFFIKKIDSVSKKFIYINSGLFIYIICSTLLFAAGNIENSYMKKIIWYSNVVLYLIYQVLIFIEWYKNFRKPSITKTI